MGKLTCEKEMCIYNIYISLASEKKREIYEIYGKNTQKKHQMGKIM
jgi:hypothetical protein